MRAVFWRGMAVLMAAAGPWAAQAQTPTPPAGTTTPPAVSNAQAPVSLTPAQKSAILDAINQKGLTAKPSLAFRPQQGEMVPPSIELYQLPDNALSHAPEAKNLKYTMMDNQVVLVDPLTMRVVDTIAK